jgi:hypothetical protein
MNPLQSGTKYKQELGRRSISVTDRSTISVSERSLSVSDRPDLGRRSVSFSDRPISFSETAQAIKEMRALYRQRSQVLACDQSMFFDTCDNHLEDLRSSHAIRNWVSTNKPRVQVSVKEEQARLKAIRGARTITSYFRPAAVTAAHNPPPNDAPADNNNTPHTGTPRPAAIKQRSFTLRRMTWTAARNPPPNDAPADNNTPHTGSPRPAAIKKRNSTLIRRMTWTGSFENENAEPRYYGKYGGL